jgi:hypothetical protein
MTTFTELQTLRQTLEMEKQDLRRFLNDPQTYAESIATTKRLIEQKEAKISLFYLD